MATNKPRKRAAPKREAKAAAEVLGTAELLEMILLELATELQNNQKPRKKLEPASTLAKLRRVNEFFNNCIDGSQKLQEAVQLSTYGKRDVLPSLDWLFKKQFGITVSAINPQNGSHRGKFRLREIDINHHSKDWKPFVQFEKTKDKESAMWRKIQIATPRDKVQNITVDVTFRAGGRKCGFVFHRGSRKYLKTFRFRPDDTLGTVFDAFRSKVLESFKKDQKRSMDLNFAEKGKVEDTYLA